VPLTELCERIIAPALRRVGEDWAAGTVTVAAEHRASAICERLTRESARLAREEADEITHSGAGLHVLTGQPGDTLSQLRQLARAAMNRRDST
jgi:hypothetical protein